MCSARSELVRVSPHVVPAGHQCHHIPVTLPPTWRGPRPPVEEWGRPVMPPSPPALLSLALCGHVKQFLRQIGSYSVSGHHLTFCAFCVRNQTNIYFMLAQNKAIICNLYLYFSAYKPWFPSQLFPIAESPVTGTKPTDSWYQHYCKVRQQLASSRRSEMLSTFCTAPSFTF